MNTERFYAKILNGSPVLDEIEVMREDYLNQIRPLQEELEEECEAAVQEQVALEALQPAKPIELSVYDKTPVIESDYQRIGIDRKKYNQALQVQEAFKNTFNIGRNPELPNQAITLMTAFALVFIETASGTAFLQNMHLSAGMGGAVFLSATIALANVFLSMLAGYFGRWKTHGNNADNPEDYEYSRNNANLIFICFLGIAGFMHLEVALVRSQETLTGVEHSLAAYLAIANSPEAVLITVIGICLSAVSYIKGYHGLDDPIPHYGDTQRSIEACENRLLEHKDNGLEDIHADFDDKVALVDEQITQYRQLQLSFNQKRQSCQLKRRKLAQVIAQGETALKSQLTKINAHLLAVGGQEATLRTAQIEQLTNLHEGLDEVVIPKPYQAPDYMTEYKRALENARMKALIAWSQSFEEIFNPQVKSTQEQLS